MQDRYERQVLLSEVGESGQDRLGKSIVAVMGCGGLGTVASDILVRAGVGNIRIVDRDRPELSNLQRQSLYNEVDIVRNLPKAITASEKLNMVNSQTIIEPIVADINSQNIESMIDGVDLVIDGTDNLETRFLINDACIKHNIAWAYASVGGTCGIIKVIVPGETACLRCLLGRMPGMHVHYSKGIWSPVVHMIASLEASECLKYLLGKADELYNYMIYIDVWNGHFEKFLINRRADCPACAGKEFHYLDEVCSEMKNRP